MTKTPFRLMPTPDDTKLTAELTGLDAQGNQIAIPVVREAPLTIYLNRQEIVTAMTLGDQPEALAVGFLRNQNMLHDDEVITQIDYDEDLGVVVVRTERETNYEAKLQKKVRTSGCAQGTIYGDIMEEFAKITLSDTLRVKASELYALSAAINAIPSLYLKAGAIHGCALAEGAQPMIYVEDIGRHNAVDKIAGHLFLNKISARDKIFYTTGRLTTEMVLKTVMMGAPVLVSRSGFTEAGVALAKQANLTLIGRMRGARFTVLSGAQRIVFDDIRESLAKDISSPQAKSLGGKR
ncbi:MAG: formate dehydrogenase accessory sulfurtransferase FdhD [Candidatus Puniceispirillaceae bacterium]